MQELLGCARRGPPVLCVSPAGSVPSPGALPTRRPPMRLIPSLPLAPLGAAVTAVVLLSGCEGGDFEFDTDFFSGEESPGPSESPSPEDEENGEDEDGQDEGQASGYALPQSCEARSEERRVGRMCR